MTILSEQMSRSVSTCTGLEAESDGSRRNVRKLRASRWSTCGDGSGPGRELLARVGRLEQVAGVQLTEAADGAERGVRLLRFATGAGFDFEVLVDRGFDIGRAWLGGRPLAWWSPVGLVGPGTTSRPGSAGSAASPAGWSRPAASTTCCWAAPTTRPSSTTRTGRRRPTGCTAGTPGCPPGSAGYGTTLARRRVRAVGRGRGRADGGLRRAAGADPAGSRRTWAGRSRADQPTPSPTCRRDRRART